MFETRRDDVIAEIENAEQGDVERFRAVFGKDDPIVAVTVKQIAEQNPTVENVFCLRKRELVSASARVCALFECGKDGVLNGGGFRAAVDA